MRAMVLRGARAPQWQPRDEIFAAPNLLRSAANAEYVAVDAGVLRPDVRHRFPLERLADAHR
jgi:NADPH:quinone reductase-like Zn-dependent oxidoreductase